MTTYASLYMRQSAIRWLDYQRRWFMESCGAAQPPQAPCVEPPAHVGQRGTLFIDETEWRPRCVTLQDRLARTPLPRQLTASLQFPVSSITDHREAL